MTGDYLPLSAMLVFAVASVAALRVVHRLGTDGIGAVPVEQFVSGLPTIEHAVSRFHVRWYVLTLLFLAFDVEMLFMYPWAVVVADVGTKAVVEMFVFLTVLMLGVVYAWREGALRWV